jgi:hypothetical protein
MAKNLAKVNGACNAKIVSEGQDFQTPWVIYNPNSTNFKVLYSVHGSLNDQNEFYGDEFDGCGGGGSGSGSGSGGDVYKVTCTYYAEEESGSGSGSGSGSHIKPCKLYDSPNSIESMIVDGVEETLVQDYTFSYTGEHTVEFILKSDSIGESAFYYCDGLTRVTISDSVTSIGSYAFGYCSGLTSVTIPDSVTSIGDYAFDNCSSLTSIDIPSGVTSIGAQAFYQCSGLTSIVIPSGVTSIGYAAFQYTSLYNAVVNAVTPPTLGEGAFNNTNNCPIYVPSESVNAYKAASGWSDYKDYIEPIS